MKDTVSPAARPVDVHAAIDKFKELITAPIAAWDTELWILTHPDLRHTARVRALSDLLFSRLRGAADLLAGQLA